MARAPKWRRRKEDRPQEIVSAALDVFAERGFAATKLDEVAKRAGVTKGTLYLYFKNKEELFKAVVQQALLPNIALANMRVKTSEAATADVLRELVSTMVAAIVGTKIGAIPKLVVAEAGNFPELARFYVDEVISRGFEAFGGLVERGIKRGEFRKVDAKTVAPVIAGPLLLLAMWKHALEPHASRKIDAAAFLSAYSDILLNGLLRRDAAGG
jgi:AcrR family transcriptional regulator